MCWGDVTPWEDATLRGLSATHVVVVFHDLLNHLPFWVEWCSCSCIEPNGLPHACPGEVESPDPAGGDGLHLDQSPRIFKARCTSSSSPPSLSSRYRPFKTFLVELRLPIKQHANAGQPSRKSLVATECHPGSSRRPMGPCQWSSMWHSSTSSTRETGSVAHTNGGDGGDLPVWMFAQSAGRVDLRNVVE